MRRNVIAKPAASLRGGKAKKPRDEKRKGE